MPPLCQIRRARTLVVEVAPKLWSELSVDVSLRSAEVRRQNRRFLIRHLITSCWRTSQLFPYHPDGKYGQQGPNRVVTPQTDRRTDRQNRHS